MTDATTDSMQSYGPVGRARWIFGVAVLAAGGVAMVGTLALLPNRADDRLAVLAWIIMIGGGVLSAIAAFIVVRILSRNAHRKLAVSLERDGFTVTLEPTDEQRREIESLLHPIVLFETASRTIVPWFATRGTGAARSILAQHISITGAGRTTRTHTRTIVCLPAPQRHPELWLRRRGYTLFAIAPTPEIPDITLGEPTLDKPFLIQCPTDATAPARLLTPAIRALILAGPKRESWTMARSMICCSFSEETDASGLAVMLRRAEAMRRAWMQTPAA